ncbi:MAG: hypothetical protein ACKV2O_14265 [Acidimicrobiales bacterium]
MKRLSVAGMLLAVTLVLAVLVPGSTASAQGGSQFRITVMNGGQPVANAVVVINSAATDPRGYFNSENVTGVPNVTNSNGFYVVNLPVGTYDVHVAEPFTSYSANNLTLPSLVHYEVYAGGGGVDIGFQLGIPTGVMQGQVAYPDGTPAANVQVDAFGSFALGDTPPFGWGTTTTNSAGWFTLANLKPNQYYVVFVPGLGIRFDGVPIAAGATTGDVALWTTGNYAGVGPAGQQASLKPDKRVFRRR